MGASDLRYIVFLIHPEVPKYHRSLGIIDCQDGEIFCDLQSAREYAVSSIEDGYCTKFIIGFFVMDINAKKMSINQVESFGFKGDRKRPEQLELFT